MTSKKRDKRQWQAGPWGGLFLFLKIDGSCPYLKTEMKKSQNPGEESDRDLLVQNGLNVRGWDPALDQLRTSGEGPLSTLKDGGRPNSLHGRDRKKCGVLLLYSIDFGLSFN